MLIAHVEQEGVWSISGGIQRLAEALERLAAKLGVVFRFDAEAQEILVERSAAAGVLLRSGERIEAGAVVLNADAAALAAGLFGRNSAIAEKPVAVVNRSLSAVTWALKAETQGFPLLRHNVFFSPDYAAEFDDLFGCGRLAAAPTVYVCAQDRQTSECAPLPSSERLLLLVNAPPLGDKKPLNAEEIAACEKLVMNRLKTCGLSLRRNLEAAAITTPADFHRRFPGTGGALYGASSHGWTASFQRPASQTKIPGLYLAGGSVHPGAGVPMAALSGRLAAQRIASDRASTPRFLRAVITGGISTRSATTSALRSR
jgi:1-hydroxycarotenoid 3,4-desaturase